MFRKLAATVTLGLAVAGTVAGPAAAAATPAPNWDVATCAAFATWQHHPDQHNAVTTLRDSRHADTYLKSDVWDWYHHRDSVWTRYVHTDCTTTGDE